MPKQFSEDIDRLQNFYWNNGYDDATVSYELSPGEEKSLLITISEKQRKKMGELIVIGASASQRSLLKKLFPLPQGQPFSRNKVEAFRSEVENSAIFSEVRLDKIAKDAETIDVLVKVIPDRSRFYGFGFGWEERRGPRGTVEYQEKNLLQHHLLGGRHPAARRQLFQQKAEVNDRRGILSIDTPYLFQQQDHLFVQGLGGERGLSQLPVQPLGAGRLVRQEISPRNCTCWARPSGTAPP